jgi:hypothetical protein
LQASTFAAFLCAAMLDETLTPSSAASVCSMSCAF